MYASPLKIARSNLLFCFQNFRHHT